jgi:hypothetical protein
VIRTNRIVRLQPRESSFRFAVDAFRAVRLDDCLNALHTRTDPEAATLRGRALLRLNQPGAAVDELCAIDDARLPGRIRIELRTIAAAALARAGRRDEGRKALDEVRASAYSSGAELAAEFEYFDAFWHFTSGDEGQVRAAITRGLGTDSSLGTSESHVYSLQAIRARFLALLGALESTREDYPLQAQFLREALDGLDRSDVPDVWSEANFTYNLAVLVRDLDLEGVQFIRGRLNSLQRTSYLANFVYGTLRSLGWCSALSGDHLSAFRDFREASTVAITPCSKLLATVDRVLVAQGLNQQLTAHEELERAQDLATRIDWERIDGDGRSALLFLAQALAPQRARAARVMLERYQRIRSKYSPTSLASLDRRLRADEIFTEGVVARAEGNDGAAVRALLDAFEIWKAIGYRWRAALAAIELTSLTKDSRYAGYAAAEAAKRPASWLAERLRAATGTSS